VSLTILLLWTGLLSLTAARFTVALGGPAAALPVRFVGGVALMAALLAVNWMLTPAERRTKAERFHSPLMLGIVAPGLLLLQIRLPVVTKVLAALVPQLADAPVEAARLLLAELVWGWALLGVAASIAAKLPRLDGAARWRQLALGLFAVFGVLAVWTGQVQTLTGDEPHYLLAARSLVRDGDVDLTNDYADGLYREFFPTDALRRALPELAPELDPHDVPGVHGERRPVHQLGMSLLLAPGYLLGGVYGARLVAVLIATLAGWLCVRLAVEVSGEAGWTGGLLVVLLSPFLALGPTLHAEPAAVACLALLAWQAARSARCGKSMVATAFVAGLLCWLHLKLLPAEAILLVWLTMRSRQAGERTWWLPLAGLAIGLVSQLAVFNVMYGSWRLDAPQIAGAGKFPSAFGGAWWEGLPGLLFDQQDGLLMAWPVGLVLGVGIVRLWPRTETKWLAAAIGVHLGLIASYQLWRSGFAPAGRQLLPVVGLLGAWVGEGWRVLCTNRLSPPFQGGESGEDGVRDGEAATDLAVVHAQSPKDTNVADGEPPLDPLLGKEGKGPCVSGLLCKTLLAINVALVGLLAWLPRLRYPYEALDGFRRSPLLAKLPWPGGDVVWPALDRGGAALVVAWIYVLAWVIIAVRVGRRSEA